LSYCDLHKIDRTDLLDVLEIYPDFAEIFEKKFQVTFDLRECEMFDAKPLKKKGAKSLLKLASLHKFNSTITNNSNNNNNNNGNESLLISLGHQSDHGLMYHQNSASIQHETSRNSFLTRNIDTTTNVLNPSPDSNSANNNYLLTLNSSMNTNTLSGSAATTATSVNTNSNDVNKTDSTTTDAPRKFQNILRKKSKLIRNAVRLNPLIAAAAIQNAEKKSLNGAGVIKKQVSNIAEVEHEIDFLIS
jgi:hypothetical protein